MYAQPTCNAIAFDACICMYSFIHVYTYAANERVCHPHNSNPHKYSLCVFTYTYMHTYTYTCSRSTSSLTLRTETRFSPWAKRIRGLTGRHKYVYIACFTSICGHCHGLISSSHTWIDICVRGFACAFVYLPVCLSVCPKNKVLWFQYLLFLSCLGHCRSRCSFWMHVDAYLNVLFACVYPCMYVCIPHTWICVCIHTDHACFWLCSSNFRLQGTLGYGGCTPSKKWVHACVHTLPDILVHKPSPGTHIIRVCSYMHGFLVSRSPKCMYMRLQQLRSFLQI